MIQLERVDTLGFPSIITLSCGKKVGKKLCTPTLVTQHLRSPYL